MWRGNHRSTGAAQRRQGGAQGGAQGGPSAAAERRVMAADAAVLVPMAASVLPPHDDVNTTLVKPTRPGNQFSQLYVTRLRLADGSMDW